MKILILISLILFGCSEASDNLIARGTITKKTIDFYSLNKSYSIEINDSACPITNPCVRVFYLDYYHNFAVGSVNDTVEIYRSFFNNISVKKIN